MAILEKSVDNLSIVYCITNKANGKRYIGQTSQKLSRRWGCHLSNSKKGRGAHLNNAIRMYGRGSFVVEQIAIATTQLAASSAERAFIEIYRTLDPKLGYNLTTGGESGKKHSPSSIERMRLAHTGVVRSEEAKRKTSDSLKRAWAEGRHTGVIGKTLPESHRISISVRMSGKRHHQYRHDVLTDDIISLRRKGVLVKDICLAFGISASLIERRLNKLRLRFPRPRRGVDYAVRSAS